MTATPATGTSVIDLMVTPAGTIGAYETADVAYRRLSDTATACLAVVDADGGCVGVLSNRILAAAWVADALGFAAYRVGELLDIHPATVPYTTGLAAALEVLRRPNTDAVAVLDKTGAPVGLLTAGAVLSYLAGTDFPYTTNDTVPVVRW